MSSASLMVSGNSLGITRLEGEARQVRSGSRAGAAAGTARRDSCRRWRCCRTGCRAVCEVGSRARRACRPIARTTVSSSDSRNGDRESQRKQQPAEMFEQQSGSAAPACPSRRRPRAAMPGSVMIFGISAHLKRVRTNRAAGRRLDVLHRDDVQHRQEVEARRLLGGEIVGQQDLEQALADVGEKDAGIDAWRRGVDAADLLERRHRLVIRSAIVGAAGCRSVPRLVAGRVDDAVPDCGWRPAADQPSRQPRPKHQRAKRLLIGPQRRAQRFRCSAATRWSARISR